jgi:hypothetical protein
MNEWISIDDRLPDFLEPWDKRDKPKPYVLAVDAKGRMSVAYRYSNHPQAWTMAKPIGTVTHWMPLPEPPAVLEKMMMGEKA